MTDEVPAEAYYDFTRVGGPTLSPDGDRVAFVAVESDSDEDEHRNSVFVVPTDGSREPHRLTRVSDAGNVAWSPDGSKLGVVMAREEDVALSVGREDGGTDDESEDDEAQTGGEGDDSQADEDEVDDGEDAGGPEGPRPQVWVYDVEYGGDARQVTDFDRGVSDFDWGPDGDRVVVSARDPTDEQAEYLEQREDDGPVEVERLQHKFDGTGWLDEVRTYLFVVEAGTREAERLDDAYAQGIGTDIGGLQPAWSPDGERIAFRSHRGERPDDTYEQDLYLVGPDGSDLQRVTEGELTVEAPEWGPAGERLAFFAGDPENWYAPSDVYVADRDGEFWSVSGESDRHLRGGPPRFVDPETLLWSVGDHGLTRLARAPVDGASPPADPVDADDRYTTVNLPDVAGRTVAVLRSSPDDGTDLFATGVADLGGPPDEWTRLTDCNRELIDEYATAGCRRTAFESPGDVEVEGAEIATAEVEAITYYPPDFDPEDPDPRPLLLWIHGGPMTYDEPAYRFRHDYWTSRGYVVWTVNYRGSTSYGRSFSETLKGRWNTAEVADLLAATDAAVERGWADPDRLFVGGFSQGAVNTAYLLTRTDRYAAAAAEHGVYDLRSAFGTDDAHNWLEADFGRPWENPEGYDRASALPDAGAIETPTLVSAGEDDQRCPRSQAEQLYVAIRKQDVPAKLVVYPDEHHNVSTPDRMVHRLEQLEEWFRRFDPAVEDGEKSDGDEESEDGDGRD